MVLGSFSDDYEIDLSSSSGFKAGFCCKQDVKQSTVVVVVVVWLLQLGITTTDPTENLTAFTHK